ncbi:NAD(P)-binding protein [Atractiella rhizophila]|nr:NAD(P)-binding protein [Atractiella rhizophila]
MTSRLTGKIALVTGGSRGIGAAISRNLAAQGATILLNFNTNTSAAEQLLSELPVAHPPHSLIRGDVGSSSTLHLISSIVKELGGIDFLVLNAGIMPMIHLGNVTEENYTEMFNTNVKGPLLLVQELAPQIREEGKIILFSTSLTAAWTFTPGYLLYVATKGAIEQMGRVFSRDPSFTSRKITTNVISPGPTDTELFTKGKPQAMIDGIKNANPLKDLAKPEDVAGLVSYLVTDGGRWVNGQNLRINGGMV